MDHNSKQSNLFEINKVITLPLEEEIKQSYLNYAMSVIVGRALPDARIIDMKQELRAGNDLDLSRELEEGIRRNNDLEALAAFNCFRQEALA